MQLQWRRSALVAVVTWIGLASTSASALSVLPLVSILAPENLNVTFVGSVSGVPTGGVVLAGAVSPGDVTLIFQASAPTQPSTGTINLFNLGVRGTPSSNVVGVGTVAGGDVAVTGGLVGGTSGYGGVSFGALAIGASTDLFFLAFTELLAGEVLAWHSVNGLVSLGASVTLVPEPAAGGLLSIVAALAGGGAFRRRARS